MADQKNDTCTSAPEVQEDVQNHLDEDADGLFFEENDCLDRLEELSETIKISGGMNFLEMDGFLHGIVCHPGPVPPSVFLSEIFGEETDNVLLENEVVREAVELILERYEEILSMVEGKAFYPDLLISPIGWFEEDEDANADADDGRTIFGKTAVDPGDENPDELIFEISDEERKWFEDEAERISEAVIEDEADWAKGFLRALDMGGGLERFMSAEPREDHSLLAPLLMLAYNEFPAEEDSPNFGKPLTPESRDWACRVMPACLNGIYQFLHSPIRRKKISRNDPCPCGSGKKYKKCCLNRPFHAAG
jgi:yecA family protein